MQSGRGALVFERSGDRTVVTRATASAPLRLLQPHNHGSARWVFTSTLGGGLVAGDTIALDVEVGAGSEALVGTQASTKVYRTTDRGAAQTLDANVADGALLVLLPDPVVPFDAAVYTQRSVFHLSRTASLAVLDTVSSGRVGHGERWAFSRYSVRTQIQREGIAVIDDSLMLASRERNIARAMGRFDAFATLFVLGPALATTRAKLLDRPLPIRRAEVVASASPIGDDGAALRVAASSLEPLLDFVRDALAPLREQLGDDPFARKW